MQHLPTKRNKTQVGAHSWQISARRGRRVSAVYPAMVVMTDEAGVAVMACQS